MTHEAATTFAFSCQDSEGVLARFGHAAFGTCSHLAQQLVQQPAAIRDGEERAALVRAVGGRHDDGAVGQGVLGATTSGDLCDTGEHVPKAQGGVRGGRQGKGLIPAGWAQGE